MSSASRMFACCATVLLLAVAGCGKASVRVSTEPVPSSAVVIAAAAPAAPTATALVVARSEESEPADSPRTAEDPAPDSSAHRGRTRAIGIVQAEIVELEAHLQNAPSSGPDRRILLGRLAEAYEEVADGAMLVNDEAGRQQALRQSVQHNRAISSTYPNDPKIDKVLLAIGADSVE